MSPVHPDARPISTFGISTSSSATLLIGTDEAETPCFSPDGRWIAFFAGGKLKKVPAAGGPVVVLADAPQPRGAWWAEDGTIIFAPHHRRALMRVSSQGGEPRPLTTLANGEISHRFPQVLPGGRAVLFTASTEVDIGAGAALAAVDLASGARTTVHPRGYFGRYVPSGHVLYVQDDTLFALPFDPRRLAATGAAWRLIDSVMADGARGSAQFAVSSTGTMAYVHGRNIFEARPLAWMDRSGSAGVVRAEPAEWLNPDVSPDGRYIAMDIRADGHRDIWVYEWARGSLTRLTTEPTNEEFPVWTPDGTRIVYRVFTSSTDPGGSSLVWKRADGTGDAQVLMRGPGPAQAGLVASHQAAARLRRRHPGPRGRRRDDPADRGRRSPRLGAWPTHGLGEQSRPANARQASRPTAAGWRIHRTRRWPTRSTCSPSPGQARGSSSREASVRRGPARAASWCSRNAPSTTVMRC